MPFGGASVVVVVVVVEVVLAAVVVVAAAVVLVLAAVVLVPPAVVLVPPARTMARAIVDHCAGWPFSMGTLPLRGRDTRKTPASVRVVRQSVDDDVHLRALVVEVEDIFADTIVTRVSSIGPNCGIFCLTPGERKFVYFWGAQCAAFHGLLRPAEMPA